MTKRSEVTNLKNQMTNKFQSQNSNDQNEYKELF